MAKIFITGHTSGLGKHLYNHFKDQDITGFSFTDGQDIVADFRDIIEQVRGCDLFINNTYADGIQLPLLNQLHTVVKKMIVIGSVASDFPDPEMPDYTTHKRELESRVLQLSGYDILLLKISSDAYNNPQVILDAIDHWLVNPSVNVISFKATQDPNR
jgi:hypothetical protein